MNPAGQRPKDLKNNNHGKRAIHDVRPIQPFFFFLFVGECGMMRWQFPPSPFFPRQIFLYIYSPIFYAMSILFSMYYVYIYILTDRECVSVECQAQITKPKIRLDPLIPLSGRTVRCWPIKCSRTAASIITPLSTLHRIRQSRHCLPQIFELSLEAFPLFPPPPPPCLSWWHHTIHP